METLEKKHLERLIRQVRLKMPETPTSFIYPILITALIIGFSIFSSSDAEQKATDTKQIDTTETFNEFVERALNEKKGNRETYFLGMVSEKMQKMLKDSVQVDFNNFKWIIANDVIIHINENHGEYRNESLRGQKNVTIKDYQEIYSIINSPDNIELSLNIKSGEKYLNLTKYINRQKYTYIVLISKKKWRLTGKTLYIKKAPTIKPMPF